MLIGSLVVLYVGLHSYLCFSHLETLFWKAGSTPPRYLTICQVSQAFFLKLNLDTSSIPGGSIEKAPASSIAPRHLVDRSSFCSWIWFFVTRYLRCRRPVPRHLPQQLSRYLLIPQLSSITEGSIYSSIAILLSFLRSLSICPRLFISQTLSFSLQTCSSRILQAFSSFILLGKLLILSHSCISCFET